jgi:hypothetical protein
VPDGTRTIVRTCQATENSGTTRFIVIRLLSASGAVVALEIATELPAYGTVGGACWWVLNAEDQLQVTPDTDGNLDVFVSGYELTLP